MLKDELLRDEMQGKGKVQDEGNMRQGERRRDKMRGKGLRSGSYETRQSMNVRVIIELLK